MNYSEYRKKKAKRRTYSYWRSVEEAILLIIGVICLIAFMVTPVLYTAYFAG